QKLIALLDATTEAPGDTTTTAEPSPLEKLINLLGATTKLPEDTITTAEPRPKTTSSEENALKMLFIFLHSPTTTVETSIDLIHGNAEVIGEAASDESTPVISSDESLPEQSSLIKLFSLLALPPSVPVKDTSKSVDMTSPPVDNLKSVISISNTTIPKQDQAGLSSVQTKFISNEFTTVSPGAGQQILLESLLSLTTTEKAPTETQLLESVFASLLPPEETKTVVGIPKEKLISVNNSVTGPSSGTGRSGSHRQPDKHNRFSSRSDNHESLEVMHNRH
ncbi:unnamed protein product, partial [Allacma fusca]